MQVGLFTYALILGLVAEAVQSASHGFKQGNGEVLEVGHTVIMHTNSTTKKVLRQVGPQSPNHIHHPAPKFPPKRGNFCCSWFLRG